MVEREHIGIFGKMNAGKSSIMNLITQQETSITDPKQGTTTDTKITLMELHGLGPVKLYDTAGFDEGSQLGEKKKQKVVANLKECDLILLVIDPASGDFGTEKQLVELARSFDKQLLVIYNMFQKGAEKNISRLKEEIQELRFHHDISLSALDSTARAGLIEFILKYYEPKNIKNELLPFLERDEYYILNIPMDEETPPGRYLRPQAMCEEYITRHWAYPVSYRMDLGAARAGSALEKKRFEDFINNFKKRPKAIITDSQAMDIMAQWTPRDIPLTTFSIMMVNYASRGRLARFVEGIAHIDELKAGDKVLIAEACNHSRIQEDIGTVQIPNYINKLYPGVIIEHNFGREFQDNADLGQYKLVIHCGACMISQQTLQARLRDLDAIGIPYTNYGVFLSYIQGKEVLENVIRLWKS